MLRRITIKTTQKNSYSNYRGNNILRHFEFVKAKRYMFGEKFDFNFRQRKTLDTVDKLVINKARSLLTVNCKET